MIPLVQRSLDDLRSKPVVFDDLNSGSQSRKLVAQLTAMEASILARDKERGMEVHSATFVSLLAAK